jgi:formylglycine-generating enzyme required for sulfatase activity
LKSSCLKLSGNFNPTGVGLGCDSVQMTAALQVTGSFTANAKGQFQDKTVTTGSATIKLDHQCLWVSGTWTTCDLLSVGVKSLGFAAVTCADADGGGCTCQATVNQSGSMGFIVADPQTSGDYTVANNTFVTGQNPLTGVDLAYAYCVANGAITLTPKTTSPTMMGTISSGDTGGGAGGAGGTGGGGAAGGSGQGGASSCVNGTGQSCNGLATQCQGESCCLTCQVPGGTFPMGRNTEDCGTAGCQSGTGNEGCPVGAYCGLDEQPEHNVTVATYYLDKYKVTVGRFRQFVNAYTGAAPAKDAGANPNIAGSGWQTSWNSNLPASAADFKDKSHLNCYSTQQTWTDSPGANEAAEISCVDWYDAFAFCVWDGGRLPTEAEWEYASAGGSDNRLYPWGSADPDSTLANISGDYTLAVGSAPLGAGKFGHMDLAGGVWEWNLDWYQNDWYTQSGALLSNPANLTTATARVYRGGDSVGNTPALRSAFRFSGTPSFLYYNIGFRCARSSP